MNQKTTAVGFLQQEAVQKKFSELLGTKAKGFITSVMSAVSGNAALSKADPTSVYMAAMMAAALDLPVNQNLGFAYIIPYGDKAQFQIGVKGLTQLAQRSGQFKTISTTPVYEGQLKSQDPLKGFEFDWSAKISDTVIGYAAYFALLNGFEKTLYMSVEQVEKHGKRFSKTFGSGVWKTDFDAMAEKTVLKRLLSKYAPLSIEMQKATVADQAVINDVETMDVEYVDNVQHIEEPPSAEQTASERFLKLIQECDTLAKLEKQQKHLSKFPEHGQAYLDRMTELEAANVQS